MINHMLVVRSCAPLLLCWSGCFVRAWHFFRIRSIGTSDIRANWNVHKEAGLLSRASTVSVIAGNPCLLASGSHTLESSCVNTRGMCHYKKKLFQKTSNNVSRNLLRFRCRICRKLTNIGCGWVLVTFREEVVTSKQVVPQNLPQGFTCSPTLS